MKKLLIYDAVYAARVWVLAPAGIKEFSRLVKTIAPKYKLDDDSDEFYGQMWSLGIKEGALPRTFIVVLKNWRRGNSEDMATLVHEMFHVAHTTLDACGMTLSDETEEAYAYFLDSLVHRAILGLK